MISIDSANLEPNIRWFFRVSVGNGQIYVGAHRTQADAESDTNMIAHGAAAEGSMAAILLTEDDSSLGLAKYNDGVNWHLVVSGSAGDPVSIFQVGPFSDLDDVSHAIYRNSDIIPYKAAALIDEHSHLERVKTIQYPGYHPTLQPGKTIQVNSAYEGVAGAAFIKGVDISLDPNSIVTTIRASSYSRITR